ncbi:hypothetical protein EUGRSUZ_F03801 [Eucalyptus grandis]|uniref:Aspartic proteinase Asp1 n=2 Tax=Eucalyptus grandis TaxID=71139 RepID=A0A059BXE9_EUCGR|nr:hypothetical protein EUGRSUZ_F03801 [Eucalyptus grandis]
MDGHGVSRKGMIAAVYWVLLCAAALQGSVADIPRFWKKSVSRVGSSFVLPLSGNVYPLGYYSVSLSIGHPAKAFDLDIDTGSDLTWVQCDAPCTACTKPLDSLYKPNNNLMHCENPLCAAINTSGNQPCKTPSDQCDYEVEYADQGSSFGVLVNDYFSLKLLNGSLVSPRLAFGCGYDQHFPVNTPPPPPTAGVLGLGNGKASIISQLSNLSVIRNVLGHCLSARGGGFLFFGDDLVPSSKIAWVSLSASSSDKHYAAGPAELLYNDKPTGVKGLKVVFDSGSSYTYLNSKAYQAVLNQVRADLKGKPLKDAVEDKSLPICWKGAKPFKSVHEVKNHFKPLQLNFGKGNAQLQLLPEAYLIVTKHGNACLGILNGGEVRLGELNLIGDISMQDKMVVYDNEKKQIGWVTADCDRLPNADRDYNGDFSEPYAADFGILR